MRRAQGNDLKDFNGIFITETGAAWCVKVAGYESQESEGRHWFPKSQCEIRALASDAADDEPLIRGEEVTITCPEWLARKKDLL